MSEFANLEEAAQALSAASTEPEGVATPTVPDPAPAASQPAASAPEGDAGTTPAAAEDSFTNIDPNSLPPELQAQYKNMQADYTRKTQELAPFRELQAQGVDPERAAQALQFVEALETDPQFLTEVHGRLSAALEQMGMSPAQAAQAASAELQSKVDDPFGIGGEDEGESELAKEVAALREWREQQEAVQAEQYLGAQLQRQEMAIRQSNPEYTDADVERLYELAFAHGGDLAAADASYRAMREHFVTSYVNSKASAAEAAPVVVDGASGAESASTGFGDDLEAAHKAATTHLQNILAG